MDCRIHRFDQIVKSSQIRAAPSAGGPPFGLPLSKELRAQSARRLQKILAEAQAKRCTRIVCNRLLLEVLVLLDVLSKLDCFKCRVTPLGIARREGLPKYASYFVILCVAAIVQHAIDA